MPKKYFTAVFDISRTRVNTAAGILHESVVL
jgi:hypothetical protein